MRRRILKVGSDTRAGLIAALVGGLPSTGHALISGGDPLQATTAAGSLIMPDASSRRRLLIAAVPAHIGISLFWTYLLCRVLPSRRRALAGAAYGAAIAVFDLRIIGAVVPRIRALPLLPQVADHVLFGAIVGFLTGPRASEDMNEPRSASESD